MNRIILCGRIVKDPSIRYSQGEKPMCVANYTLAVDRRIKKEGEQNADFINCVAFGKSGEFAEKYFRKGLRVLVSGRLQTGSYMNKDGQRIYTTDVYVEEQEFADGKIQNGDERNNGGNRQDSQYGTPNYQTPAQKDGFMNIPAGVEEEGLPFD